MKVTFVVDTPRGDINTEVDITNMNENDRKYLMKRLPDDTKLIIITGDEQDEEIPVSLLNWIPAAVLHVSISLFDCTVVFDTHLYGGRVRIVDCNLQSTMMKSRTALSDTPCFIFRTQTILLADVHFTQPIIHIDCSSCEQVAIFATGGIAYINSGLQAISVYEPQAYDHRVKRTALVYRICPDTYSYYLAASTRAVEYRGGISRQMRFAVRAGYSDAHVICTYNPAVNDTPEDKVVRIGCQYFQFDEWTMKRVEAWVHANVEHHEYAPYVSYIYGMAEMFFNLCETEGKK